ncbi:hypothetical protein [Pararhodobacter aggregans]|uniref:hypothetical protein n=1 Tax=Pararhodobacter aggregans TaxID=404875 RepID=UPI003A95B201
MPRPTAEILADVKRLAVEYYLATGKPLGVTGEIAEAEVGRLLGLDLLEARSPGYDALRRVGDRVETIQIKGRWKRQGRDWGRVPSINTDQPFDVVMLVLMQGDYEVFEIWQASREAVVGRLDLPGSRARNERRAMAVAQFKAIATQIWPTGG